MIRARFVKSPVNGVECDALLIEWDNLLFDVACVWYGYTGNLTYDKFMNLHPSYMAEIALDVFEAGLLDVITKH